MCCVVCGVELVSQQPEIKYCRSCRQKKLRQYHKDRYNVVKMFCYAFMFNKLKVVNDGRNKRS